jgi:hypothetical protein
LGKTRFLALFKVLPSERIKHLLECVARRPGRVEDKHEALLLRRGILTGFLADCFNQLVRQLSGHVIDLSGSRLIQFLPKPLVVACTHHLHFELHARAIRRAAINVLIALAGF